LKKIKVLCKTIWILLTDWELALSFSANACSLFLIRLKLLFGRKKFIVIALTEVLGDIVASEPISRYMKGKFPVSFICWVTDKKYAELITSNPNIDKAITVSCFTEWILLKHILRKRNVYDLHINNKVCVRHHFINKKNNPFNINFDNYFEKGNLLYAFSRSAAIEISADSSPILYLKSGPSANISGKYIVVHTTATNQEKTMSVECWNKLAGFILERFEEFSIVEIGFEKKINLENNRIINLTGQKSLSFISDLIRNSRLFIGIDSSFAHFANALNKDSLILIGKLGNFINYMPYSGMFQKEEDKIIYHYSESLQKMRCSDIFPLVSKKLTT